MRERRPARTRLRAICQIEFDGRAYQGIVLDVSPAGLFVQTTAPVPPCSRLRVDFPTRAGRAGFAVQARVARRRTVPARLASLISGGLGLEILDPPPDFVAMLREGVPESPQEQNDADVPRQRYRVRGTQPGAPRSRTLELEASSPEEARRRAKQLLPSGWEVLEVVDV